MSNDTGHPRDPDEAALALYLHESGSCDALIDILVAALDDALRILREEIGASTVH